MSEILNTKYGTYDLNDRKSAYRYFCQNFGFHSRDMSLIEQYFITEYEELEKQIEKLQKKNEKLRDALIKISIRTEIDAYRKTALNLTDDMMAIEQIVSKSLKEIDNDPAS